MTSIVEEDLVLAPFASAESFLQAFFDAHLVPQCSGVRLVLRAAGAAKAVVAGIENVRQPGDMKPRYTIHWEVEDGGPYPVFDGELRIVNAGADYNGFWLVLSGAYVPPGGLAGEVFDRAIGKRVARSTARGLLREIRVAIEAFVRERAQSA